MYNPIQTGESKKNSAFMNHVWSGYSLKANAEVQGREAAPEVLRSHNYLLSVTERGSKKK